MSDDKKQDDKKGSEEKPKDAAPQPAPQPAPAQGNLAAQAAEQTAAALQQNEDLQAVIAAQGEELKQLKAKEAERQAAETRRDVESVVSATIAAGKADPSEKDRLVEEGIALVSIGKRELFADICANRAAVWKQGEVGQTTPGGPTQQNEAEVKKALAENPKLAKMASDMGLEEKDLIGYL